MDDFKIRMALNGEEVLDLAPDEIKTVLDIISGSLKVRVSKIVKHVYPVSKTRFEFITSRGTLWVNGLDVIISQTKMRYRVADKLGFLLPRYSRDLWHNVVQSILNVCEECHEEKDWFYN